MPKYVFQNDAVKQSFYQVRQDVRNLLDASFDSLLADEVMINSGFRNDATSHKDRISVDIGYIRTPSGETNFHRLNPNYSREKDQQVFSLLKGMLKQKLFSYLSPYVIYHTYGKELNRTNIHHGKSASEIERIINNTADQSLDARHLDHLHISLTPEYTGDYSDGGDSFFLWFAGIGIIAYALQRQGKKNIGRDSEKRERNYNEKLEDSEYETVTETV